MGIKGSKRQNVLNRACWSLQTGDSFDSFDSGPMHIGLAVKTRTLAIVGNDCEGEGQAELWFPKSDYLSRTVSSQSCSKCSENKFKNDECIADEHVCMKGVDATEVIELIKRWSNESKSI